MRLLGVTNARSTTTNSEHWHLMLHASVYCEQEVPYIDIDAMCRVWSVTVGSMGSQNFEVTGTVTPTQHIGASKSSCWLAPSIFSVGILCVRCWPRSSCSSPWSHKPVSLNARLGNSEIGGARKSANPSPTLRQPCANPSPTLRQPSPTLCQPFCQPLRHELTASWGSFLVQDLDVSKDCARCLEASFWGQSLLLSGLLQASGQHHDPRTEGVGH